MNRLNKTIATGLLVSSLAGCGNAGPEGNPEEEIRDASAIAWFVTANTIAIGPGDKITVTPDNSYDYGVGSADVDDHYRRDSVLWQTELDATPQIPWHIHLDAPLIIDDKFCWTLVFPEDLTSVELVTDGVPNQVTAELGHKTLLLCNEGIEVAKVMFLATPVEAERD